MSVFPIAGNFDHEEEPDRITAGDVRRVHKLLDRLADQPLDKKEQTFAFAIRQRLNRKNRKAHITEADWRELERLEDYYA